MSKLAWGTLGSPVGGISVACSAVGVARVRFGPPPARPDQEPARSNRVVPLSKAAEPGPGGAQARRLQEVLDGFHDPLVYNVAEIGLGMNDRSQLIGIMLEDEAVAGTVHIGIGTSITLGGTVKAACHYDLLLWHPTVDVDGTRIVDNGTFLD